MSTESTAHQYDWLTFCREAARRIGEVLGTYTTIEQRSQEIGQGKGGDRTLVIDQAAEDIVFEQLDEAYRQGARFRVISEERGEVDFGDDSVLVLVDPIDGSMNAKRGLTHHALAIGVAHGPTMADIIFGYVHDFGAREEWVAQRGQGTQLNGQLIVNAGERRTRDGRLEIVGVEANPDQLEAGLQQLSANVFRTRLIGSIAISTCQVAASRFDGVVILKPARCFDVAGATLIVQEAGGLVSFSQYPELDQFPLDIQLNSPLVAALTSNSLSQLREILS
jgi:myo-inositol-1(or 4)-monophosphatase